MDCPGSYHSLQMLTIFFFFIFSFSAALLVRAENTSPDIFLTACGKTLSKNAQEMDVNFVNVMELIFQNITNTGFGTAVFGTSNTVYGLGQCFNYLSPVDCQLCYSECRVKLPHCTPNTTGRIYVDGCFLRYAGYNMSMEATDASDTSICVNSQAVSASIYAKFNETVVRLVGNLTSDTHLEKDYYKVGSLVVSGGLTVYGMAQCWRSLNRSGCRQCMESARGSALGCLPAAEAKALNAGCFLRYSTEPFYLADGRVVAVKRLFFNTRQWIDMFLNEVNLVNQVQHKNLVKLFGCSVDGPESLLVYEYLSNKSLDYFLFGRSLYRFQWVYGSRIYCPWAAD